MIQFKIRATNIGFFLLSLGLVFLWASWPNKDVIPKSDQLIEVSDIRLVPTEGRNAGVWLVPPKTSEFGKEEWFVGYSRFDRGIPMKHLLNSYGFEKHPKASVLFYPNNKYKKIWEIKLGAKAVLSYEGAVENFEDDKSTSKFINKAGILFILLAIVSCLKIHRIDRNSKT